MIRRLSMRGFFGLLVAATTVASTAAQNARGTEPGEEGGRTAAGDRSGVLYGANVEGLYEFTEPKLGIYSAPGNTFVSASDGSSDRLARDFHGYSHVSTGVGALFVNMTREVHLPNGATVTTVRCRYYDNTNPEGINADFFFLRRGKTATNSSAMAEFSLISGGLISPTVQTRTDVSIVDPVINNFNFDYFLFVSWNPGTAGAGLRFYGCDIEYTYDYLSN